MEQTRLDMYTAVHKGLRAAMGQVLQAVGNVDHGDERELAEVLGQVRGLLELLGVHLQDEERFVHTAMEARLPGSSAGTGEDHVGHELALDELESDVQALERADAAGRAAASLRLYRRLARFVAENFEHVHVEETHNQMILWATHSDAELLAIEQALVAAIPPAAMQVFTRWMLVATSHPERVAMLSSAPPEVFDGMLGLAREHLSQRDWSKLARALGVAAAPGLVEVWRRARRWPALPAGGSRGRSSNGRSY
jgi:hypothetical protein